VPSNIKDIVKGRIKGAQGPYAAHQGLHYN